MAEAGAGFDIERIKRDLDERGVAVVPNVISEKECDDYVTEYHQWLAKFGAGFPDNVTSIIHKYRIAHMNANWRIRLKAKPLFAQIWGTDKLLTSFDGVAIAAPPETNNPSAIIPPDVEEQRPLKAYKLHHDQGFHKVGLHAYQGAVYLEDTAIDDWAFVVVENSHLHHREFFEEFVGKRKRSEFRVIREKELDWLQKRSCQVKRIACPKGGMILWDSRTVHAGAPPLKNRSNPNKWRYVSFVSMAPAIWASEDDIKTKVDGYHKLKCSRHWPCQGASCFRENACGEDLYAVTSLPEVAKTEEVKQLMGVELYDFDDGRSNGPNWRPKCREE